MKLSNWALKVESKEAKTIYQNDIAHTMKTDVAYV